MFHRIGGAVRRVFAGVTHRAPHHPAALPDLTPAAQQPPDSHAPPRRPRAPRRPPAAQPEAPPRAQSVAQPEAPPEAQPRRGWFARWFGRRPRPTALPLPPLSDSDSYSYTAEDNMPFTPENHPGLTPEVCDFFNTRIDDCDPEMLHIVLAVIATLVAESLPPELRTDPRAIVADIWDRLREPGDETAADAIPHGSAEEAPDSLTEAAPHTQPDDALADLADAGSDEQPDDAPDSLAEAAPDTQPGDAPAGPMATTPAEPPGDAPANLTDAASDKQPDDALARPKDAVPDAPAPLPAALPETLVAAAPESIAVAVATDPSYPAAPPQPDHHSRAHHRHRGRVPGRSTSSRRLRGCRPPRLDRRELPPCPPPRRLCYAACAGPP